MRIFKHAAILLLSAGAAVPAHAQHGAHAGGTVEGIVTATDTRAPLEFAQVSAGGRQTSTDDAGRFRLCDVPPGDVVVVASASLHDTAIATASLAPGDTVRVNPVLERDTSFPVSILHKRHSSSRPLMVPLFYLDGERVVIDTSACASPPPGVRLVTEIPADIEAIHVLRREDAVAQYGADGRDGVVLITTRGGREP